MRDEWVLPAGRQPRASALTGTPLENRVEEFRNLVGYLQPRIARRVSAADAVAGAKAFRRAVAPVYLRRNQADVLTELPDKIEIESWVQLSDTDDAAYRSAVAARNVMGMRQATLGSSDSAKLNRLTDLVEEAEQDAMKVVIFSYFLGTLELISRALGLSVVGTITGSVTPAVRQRIVDEFTRRPGHAVLLGQIEAGGVGINMQAASVVILTEPQWKPSTEEQAIARAHRMGQVRTVQVHRLLAKDSIDERICEIQQGNGCCSTSSPARARRRRLIGARSTPRPIGRTHSTTSRCRWSDGCCWPSGTGWASTAEAPQHALHVPVQVLCYASRTEHDQWERPRAAVRKPRRGACSRNGIRSSVTR
jgi:Helicase conserved C-terminal domain